MLSTIQLAIIHETLKVSRDYRLMLFSILICVRQIAFIVEASSHDRDDSDRIHRF
jgi:hypothetical protein